MLKRRDEARVQEVAAADARAVAAEAATAAAEASTKTAVAATAAAEAATKTAEARAVAAEDELGRLHDAIKDRAMRFATRTPMTPPALLRGLPTPR